MNKTHLNRRQFLASSRALYPCPFCPPSCPGRQPLRPLPRHGQAYGISRYGIWCDPKHLVSGCRNYRHGLRVAGRTPPSRGIRGFHRHPESLSSIFQERPFRKHLLADRSQPIWRTGKKFSQHGVCGSGGCRNIRTEYPFLLTTALRKKARRSRFRAWPGAFAGLGSKGQTNAGL